MIALLRACCAIGAPVCWTCGGDHHRPALGQALTAAVAWVGEVWPIGGPEPPRPRLRSLLGRLVLVLTRVEDEEVRAWLVERARAAARREWDRRVLSYAPAATSEA